MGGEGAGVVGGKVWRQRRWAAQPEDYPAMMALTISSRLPGIPMQHAHFRPPQAGQQRCLALQLAQQRRRLAQRALHVAGAAQHAASTQQHFDGHQSGGPLRQVHL